MLLTCGGLLLQTFQHLRNTDVGFRSERLLTFETPLFRYKDFDRRVAFINAELEAVRAIPGVVNAGAINRIPFTNVADATFYWLEGQPRTSIPQQVALMRNVSRDYFATDRCEPARRQVLQRDGSGVQATRGHRQRAVCQSPFPGPISSGPEVQVRIHW